MKIWQPGPLVMPRACFVPMSLGHSRTEGRGLGVAVHVQSAAILHLPPSSFFPASGPTGLSPNRAFPSATCQARGGAVFTRTSFSRSCLVQNGGLSDARHFWRSRLLIMRYNVKIVW
eukprot:1160703-Pelagomonas_calceolata.AAC.4